MSNLFNGKFLEMSNLRRKFALSTNCDSWFTYCVLNQQISASHELELSNLENFWFRSQKLHLAIKFNLGSLLWFHLSISCPISYLR